MAKTKLCVWCTIQATQDLYQYATCYMLLARPAYSIDDFWLN